MAGNLEMIRAYTDVDLRCWWGIKVYIDDDLHMVYCEPETGVYYQHEEDGDDIIVEPTSALAAACDELVHDRATMAYPIATKVLSELPTLD